MNHIEMPLINLAGHGDVHVYGIDEVRELCRKAGLVLEKGEKRVFPAPLCDQKTCMNQ